MKATHAKRKNKDVPFFQHGVSAHLTSLDAEALPSEFY